ncbi:MAG: HAD family hydrolase [Planctomycetota bacterium]
MRAPDALPRPKAILFDLDDTILDTTLSATRVWHATAEAFAEEIGSPPEVFNPVLDAARKWYWADPQRNHAGRLDVRRSRVEVTLHGLEALELGRTREALEHLAERFTQHYSDHRVGSMRFFDGALETLEALHAGGMPMALITNGDAIGQREKVERFGLETFFRAVLIEGERGFGKPDERVFRVALEACGAEAVDAWCVGDNLGWEVAAPQRLGITGVWVDWAGVELPEGGEVVPDAVVRGIRELPGLIEAAG